MRRLFHFLLPVASLLAQVYTYDDAGRLTRAVYPEGGGAGYTWDAADNLLRVDTMQVPPMPSSVGVTRLSPTSARISWNETAGATGYRVERRASGEAAWQLVATVGSAGRSFVDESLTGNREYFYRVSALGPDGAGVASTEVSTDSGRPQISENGVVNGATFRPENGVAAGSIVSIFGSDIGVTLENGQLRPVTAIAEGAPLPTQLAGHSVEIGGRPAPMYFVSGSQGPDGQITGQINVQIPWATPPGQTDVVVRRREGDRALESSPRTVRVSPASPGIFTFPGGSGGGAVVNPDGSIAQPEGSLPGVTTRPASRGEVILIYLTGLGAVDPPVEDGQSSLDALRTTRFEPRVLIGGVPADVIFSGLAPQFVGLYQINARIPAAAPAGDRVLIRVEAGGASSREDVTIAIR